MTMRQETPVTGDRTHGLPGDDLPVALLRGERVLWSGRPAATGFAVRVVRLPWLGAYFAAVVVFGLYQDRAHGLSIALALRGAWPLTALAILTLALGGAVAWGWSRTTRYVVTTERCLVQYGLALTGTLSLPWRRVARVALALHADGSGDIALAPRRPHRLRFVKLWPHTRPWRVAEPEPTLRFIADAAIVAARIRDAMASDGARAAGPGERRVPRRDQRPDGDAPVARRVAAAGSDGGAAGLASSGG